MARLLIVDDESDVREFSRNFFRKRGIDVLTAASGREALALIDQTRPDLVLLDIRMDDVNGVEVVRELRRRNDPLRIVIVSGLEDESIVQEVKALGVAGFIHKPLVLEDLEKIVLSELNRTA
ncbi:MAG: response regulator [Candidatus Omnitrophica bacterium]|nr:response regulator [Candidatus Omnitrophota bacterium]